MIFFFGIDLAGDSIPGPIAKSSLYSSCCTEQVSALINVDAVNEKGDSGLLHSVRCHRHRAASPVIRSRRFGRLLVVEWYGGRDG
jgi:hypothetical protein